MHDLLDDYAHSNALRETSARLKLLLGLGAILLCVSSSSPIAPLFIALTMSLATVRLAKIPARFYCTLLLIPSSFSILSAVVVAFMHGGGEQLFALNLLGIDLGIREEGGNLALLLIARTFGGMCSLFFIALTTPMLELFSIGKSLGLPDFLVELSMLMYRYIFVFLDQAARIHSAQVMRLGDAGFKSTLSSFSMLSSVLFLRSWEQGERLIVAMDCRCYDGKLDLMDQGERAKPAAIIAVAVYLIATAAIAVLTRNILIL
ncbi:MAG: Energy-coupling factor transporter transmembrane protein EcfT [Methanosaeta sp. PtaU1.Bin112]|nr:MAG: Energy-coupling factor transporter transmembrane protein EcfT [Methanosaeta sp. PtaU1.Bin112]